MSYDINAMIEALVAQGYSHEQAANVIAEDLQRQANEKKTVEQNASKLRNEHGQLNTDAHKAFFSRARMEQEAKKYYDPLEGVDSVDNLSKKQWVDIITGRNKATHTPRPLNNVQDGIAFFQNLRNKNQ
ncbi:hypothetical protein [Leclercia adecarboxylata]|nr:hypothetical protein [Leclercia adecarboxylata]MDV5240173.1 hypothetical protein [Leclercia adecarboxylata]MDV5276737.1 hypothetical protein [Leclercia adecarboxylata]MDV5460680.1 hypothetical protein [Leclercia adecarboxylata]MDV5504173.1 hypothetical protein [Leclercia adecarboxylata]MDV5534710.1 hypothetical protein [Leclercia adecarboxylata]